MSPGSCTHVVSRCVCACVCTSLFFLSNLDHFQVPTVSEPHRSDVAVMSRTDTLTDGLPVSEGETFTAVSVWLNGWEYS